MAVSSTKKSKSASGKKSAKKSFLSRLKFKGVNRQNLTLPLSVILNAILIVALLFSVSNPTTFTDASSGFSVDIPAGWARQDKFEVFRITEGKSQDPRAQIFAYGQRNATVGFYDSPKDERDSTLDLVTSQINEGQNQFILTRFELTNYQFTAERGQKPDGTEYIQSHFTATDSQGQPVEGEHLLMVTMGGGVYSIVAWADADYWPQVSGVVADTISTFTAP